jgi:RNA polymerase-binding transcription factor DksA
MDTAQLQHYARTLEKERDMLEQQLDKLGVRADGDDEWTPKVPSDLDINTADESEIGDLSEETQIDEIVLEELETRYQHIVHALKKIDDGTYGICEVSGQPIEKDRLDANPAARTCKAHLNDELPEVG